MGSRFHCAESYQPRCLSAAAGVLSLEAPHRRGAERLTKDPGHVTSLTAPPDPSQDSPPSARGAGAGRPRTQTDRVTAHSTHRQLSVLTYRGKRSAATEG